MPEQLYKIVNGVEVPLSEEETSARLAEEQAWSDKQAQITQLQAAIAPLEAAFGALPRGKRSLLKGIREDVREALENGDIAAAREILETAPADLYGDAETDRNNFISLLPSGG